MEKAKQEKRDFLVYASAGISAPPIWEKSFSNYDDAAKYAKPRRYLSARVVIVGPDGYVIGY